jgi:hypothetical protein
MQATHQAPQVTTEIAEVAPAQAAAIELSAVQLALVGGGTGIVALF